MSDKRTQLRLEQDLPLQTAGGIPMHLLSVKIPTAPVARINIFLVLHTPLFRCIAPTVGTTGW